MHRVPLCSRCTTRPRPLSPRTIGSNGWAKPSGVKWEKFYPVQLEEQVLAAADLNGGVSVRHSEKFYCHARNRGVRGINNLRVFMVRWLVCWVILESRISAESVTSSAVIAGRGKLLFSDMSTAFGSFLWWSLLPSLRGNVIPYVFGTWLWANIWVLNGRTYLVWISESGSQYVIMIFWVIGSDFWPPSISGFTYHKTAVFHLFDRYINIVSEIKWSCYHKWRKIILVLVLEGVENNERTVIKWTENAWQTT